MSALALSLFLAVGCGRTGDENRLAPVSSPSLPPNPAVLDLFGLKPSDSTVSDIVSSLDSTAPKYVTGSPRLWFVPGSTPEPAESQVLSFIRLEEYEDAGLIGVVAGGFAPEESTTRHPLGIMWVIAWYESTEGAAEALDLGARIGAVFQAGSFLITPARQGKSFARESPVEELGEGAVAQWMDDPRLVAVSVRVDQYVGTIVTGYAKLPSDESALAETRALAAALAANLVSASD